MKRREIIGDIEVAFQDEGQGGAVVLLPPFPFDSRIWAGNIASIADAGRRVIAPDYPGFGDSPQLSEPISIARLGEVLGRLLDRLGIRTAVVVGVSMGGYVALAFAAQRAANLEALVLADTRAAADSPAVRAGRASALGMIRERGVDAYLDQSLPRLLAPDAGPDRLAQVRALAEKRPEVLAAGIVALRDRPDRASELVGIRCRTLVLVGEADQICPSGEAHAMATAISGARFVEIPHAGHLSNLEAPTAFNGAVVDFLRAVPAASLVADRARGERR
jgi:3-oxoadipate enol-lactonase